MKNNIGFHQALYKLITLAFTGFFGVSSFLSGVKAVKITEDENFEAVLRFAVCSDIHLSKDEKGLNNAEKFKKALKRAYEISEKSDGHNTLDAVIVAGDMTDSGKEEEYNIYSDITNEYITEETQLLTCMGNHEHISYRDTENPEKAIEVFKEKVGSEVDVHTVICGYHFIGFSYDANGKETFDTKLEWIKQQLELAKADTGDKPIFVFQHPHPALTVYGSINWANWSISKIFKSYPQIVDFSGHSHYAANDPRSINQGAFTSIGTGALTGLMGNLGYISGDEYGDEDSGCFWICEADKNGNVRLKLYDIVSDCFYSDVNYYLTELSNKQRRVYTWNRMSANDTSPVFPDEATVTAARDDDGNVNLTFPEAQGYYRAENYKITLTDKNGKKIQKVVLSDYIRATDFEKTVNFGTLESGTYSVKIKAYSPYAKLGDTLTESFSV